MSEFLDNQAEESENSGETTDTSIDDGDLEPRAKRQRKQKKKEKTKKKKRIRRLDFNCTLIHSKLRHKI